VRVEHRGEADYGRALRAGLLSAEGAAVVNFDTDFFDLEFLAAAVSRVLAPDGPAIVVGSKRGEGASDDRAALRKLATAVFSTVLRVGFGIARVRHARHQGHAPRSGGTVRPARVTRGQDLFDTELILRVERAGLHTSEIPVGVTELRPARTSDHEAGAPYTARLGEAALGVVQGTPRVTALVAARILNGEGGTSASPAWLVTADGSRRRHR